MELIDRYIHEVGHFLPRKNRADIQAELRSLLLDTLEARTQGKPTEEDAVTLLKEYGPPEKVAASYAPESQYVIGPTLFPAFRTVVGIALAVMVFVHVLTFGISLAINGDLNAAAGVFGDFISSLLSMLGAVVLVFYILQQFNVRVFKLGKEWDPRSLPAVEESKTVNRTETIFEIAFGLLFMALLLAFPGRFWLTTTGSDRIVISDPVIATYLPLILLSLFLGIGLDAILLWQGRWQTVTRVAKLATELFGIAVLGLLIAGHNTWLAAQGVGSFEAYIQTISSANFPDQQTVQILVMQSVRLALFIALVVSLVELVKQGYQLARRIIGEGAVAAVVPSQGNHS